MKDKRSWVIGGGTLIGVGVGLTLFQLSVFYFVASVLVGIGLGLVVAPFVSREKGRVSRDGSG